MRLTTGRVLLLVYLNADISDELEIFEAVGVLVQLHRMDTLSSRRGSATGLTDPRSLISTICVHDIALSIFYFHANDRHSQHFLAIFKSIAGRSLILDLHYVLLEQKYLLHPEWE